MLLQFLAPKEQPKEVSPEANEGGDVDDLVSIFVKSRNIVVDGGSWWPGDWMSI